MANLWSLFVEQAQADPTALALVFPDRTMSFGELLMAAERSAAALVAHGVSRGDIVALQIPKRRIAYAMLLGCLRLGAPYVFLDPKNPADRTALIVERLKPRVLVSEIATSNPYGAALTVSRETGDSWLETFERYPSDDVWNGPVGTDPAYVMFTSGSTGEPKGAVIPHQGVVSLSQWARSMGHGSPSERFTGLNPLHFDNSVFDIYCGLFNGAALVPIETSEITNPASWVRTIRNGQATVMFAVPTLFLMLDQLGLLTPDTLPHVRIFQFGGEGYPVAKLAEFQQRFAGQAELINVYGPTETSCICSSIRITPEVLAATGMEFAPLGRMHPDFSYRIIGEDEGPCAVEEAGELWIGGPCVGLGYYANPEQTQKQFRQDPCQDAFRSVWYRTGDLVREDGNGWLWFQGRVDNQVKIRGHRIELEEVDFAVQSVRGVRRAVSAVMPGLDGGEIAVAYSADGQVGTDEIMAACKARLPAYMRPARVIQLPDLPRNANGKVDRKAVRSLIEKVPLK
ncbi:MAG: amino acid adenylation domain-containing protein [Devosia sp.]